MICPGLKFPADLRQTSGIGTIETADNNHQISLFGNFAGFFLAYRSRIANGIEDSDFYGFLQTNISNLTKVFKD